MTDHDGISGRHRPDCPGGGLCTLDSDGHAGIVRRRGWGVGTVLVGEEGYGDARIRIEYVGRDVLICAWLDQGGREATSTLTCRCWCEVDPVVLVTCTHCGRVNRDGHWACDRCGALLPGTEEKGNG